MHMENYYKRFVVSRKDLNVAYSEGIKKLIRLEAVGPIAEGNEFNANDFSFDLRLFLPPYHEHKI